MKMTADMSLDALLEMARENPDAVGEIERRFRANVAILVVDFSSMRRRMDAFGIVPALLDIRMAMSTYLPAVEASQGRVIKSVADTVFAVFDSSAQGLRAALEGHHRMAEFNANRGGDICRGIPNAPIYPKAGLGFGESLLTPEGNLYGTEVNRAFILGEDVARNCEILASVQFVATLGVPPVGVGVHAAPHDREEESGFPFHIVTDYRFDDDA